MAGVEIRLCGLYGTVERGNVIVGWVFVGADSSDSDDLRDDGFGEDVAPPAEVVPAEAATGGAGGGGISLYTLVLIDLGDSGRVRDAEPDVDGREMEAVGDEGAAAPERVGESLVSGTDDANGGGAGGGGERGAICWFPGSASGELVAGAK